jgi:hypothetical protein
MVGLVATIHLNRREDVDGRDKGGHDGKGPKPRS